MKHTLVHSSDGGDDRRESNVEVSVATWQSLMSRDLAEEVTRMEWRKSMMCAG